jgi:hypothetical protein
MRLLHHPFAAGIPGVDAKIHTPFNHGIEMAQPLRISTDSPIPVYLHDSSKLTICGCIKIMLYGADGHVGPEALVPFMVLVFTELCSPE